ncbi:hypothetical protein [Bradyrhizobium liaoningense]|uniref:hypothetical protein n=1 Tax=Bradyrhizobium liaoningense TaxID=43992 RepID=UPI001BAD7A07|nr:hypothetical protein [Bradyrhizobium liaoningense]MBR0983095.1 hypothetical protein [Bradyrhizobium liaoningense]
MGVTSAPDYSKLTDSSTRFPITWKTAQLGPARNLWISALTRRSRNSIHNLPIYWVQQMGIRTYDLVELAPTWRQHAATALPAIPPLIVGGSEAISDAILETKDAFIFIRKGFEEQRVQQESEKDVMF